MKYLYLLLGLFFPLNAATAQSVTVGTISKTTLCLGDTVWVPYTSSGSFAADNFFAVQRSDANGDFTTFTNVGHSTDPSGLIPVVIGGAGNNWVLRVIATDPYTISSDSSPKIQVVSYPSPIPSLHVKQTHLGATAFIGDLIQFSDSRAESSGCKYEWSFGQDANIFVSIDPSPKVTYLTEGIKSGSLSVTNTTGCSTSVPFQLVIMTCNPIIPDSVHIVTGTETSAFPYVWVKAGANFSTKKYSNINYTVFVEPGGTVFADFGTAGIYYLKNGASFSASSQAGAEVMLQTGNSIPYGSFGSIDTLYCNDLQFDYSQVTQKEVEIEENPLLIQTTANGLQITKEGEEISASIVNPLGVILFSKTERDMLSVDYSILASGVYFVIITSGNHREMRKIAIVH